MGAVCVLRFLVPAPLPPHPDNPNSPENQKPKLLRLSFINPAQVAPPPGTRGRPTDPNLLQLDASFNVHTGEGAWGIFLYPNETWYDSKNDVFLGQQWEAFRRHVRRLLLKTTPDQFEFLLDYLHNYRVLNIHLITGDVSAWREGDPSFPPMI